MSNITCYDSEPCGVPSFESNYGEWLRYQELLQGIIRIDSSISSGYTSTWLRELRFISRLGNGKGPISDLSVIISSPGGGAYYSLAIYDELRRISTLGTHITCVVEGYAASAASMIILQAGDVRISRPNARYLLHEGRRWIFWAMERTSDVKDEVKEMEALEQRILEILADRCGRPVDEVRSIIERKEVWMSAQEALEWKLIDKIE